MGTLHWRKIRPSYSRPWVSDDECLRREPVPYGQVPPARSSRPVTASRICQRRGSGPARSCIGTTTTTATAASATSARRSTMRGRTGRSWRRGMRYTCKRVRQTRNGGRVRPTTGRPLRPHISAHDISIRILESDMYGFLQVRLSNGSLSEAKGIFAIK